MKDLPNAGGFLLLVTLPVDFSPLFFFTSLLLLILVNEPC
jgi:hypothetical protein